MITFISCTKDEGIQEIPSYIRVNSIHLSTNSDQGENTQNITDIWVYANDQFMGTYELPVTFPILLKGNNNIKIFAGIKDNGISGTRVRYHFYKSYEEDIFLKEDSITDISPEFIYTSSANIESENFEGVGVDWEKDTLNSEIDFEIKTEGNGNKYASAIVEGNHLTFQAVSKDFEDLPQVGSPVYLEMDYKCNHDVVVGAYVTYSTTVVNKNLVIVTPKEEWHKIYINLTKTVSEAIGNQSIKFYLNLHRTNITDDVWFKFDNLKLVY